MKKQLIILLSAALLTLAVIVGGCGLVSGTVFLSQEVNGTIEAQHSAAAAEHGAGRNPLDSFGGAKVDLRDNEDWKKITIDGIEDVCVRLTAVNLMSQSVSGEAWVTLGEDSIFTDIAAVQAAGGFRIFSGLLMGPNETITYPCAETYQLFENLDKLVDAIKTGVFWVWGRGDQDTYHIRYEAIYLGIHVTGSL
jgi:hypothetical protein